MFSLFAIFRSIFLVYLVWLSQSAFAAPDAPVAPQQAVRNVSAEEVNKLQKQAAAGDVEAQFNLGVMYNKGEGASEDVVLSYAWLNLAATTGYEKAKTLRDLQKNLMSQEDLAEAQQLASTWKLGQLLQRRSARPPSAK